MSSSSSSSVSATTVNGTTRVTGLSSGIDVDSIVEQLMTANKTKLNKLNQKEQLAEWKQEAYRDIISDIQDFSDTYFKTGSDSNIMSKKYFQAYGITSSNTALTAEATANASSGSHAITVSQLATAATKTSTNSLATDITGTIASSSIDYSTLAGTSFTLTIDDTDYTISLDSTVTDLASLQDAIDSVVGDNKVTIDDTSDSSGYLTLTAADSGVQALTLSDPDSDDATSSLSILGLTSGQSNRISTSSTLATLATSMGITANDFFDDDGQVELTINGVDFSFDKTETTLSEMITEINNSDAGVTMKYDELSGKLIMTADKTGAGNTLSVTETGSSFLKSVFGATDITTVSGVSTTTMTAAGQDAKLTVDGVSLTRSSNTVTVDGVTYTFTDEITTAATVSLTQDADTIYDNISKFVDSYNTLLESINDKLNEDYDDDYPPLTDDQKEDMSDDEIEKWETKAKTGLLSSDNTLQTFVSNLRQALMDSVSGTKLASIGITTGTYDEQGKLYIDEDKLKEAIQSDSEGVMNLFTQQSETYPTTATARKLSTSERAVRYKEEGLSYRIYDILQNNISTLTDSNGNKGLLLLKAGVENDSSETDNALSDEITEIQKKIDKEEDRLDDLSDRLYEQYTTLETYINQMNSQLSSLSSMMGSE